jgi:hypothetical protein
MAPDANRPPALPAQQPVTPPETPVKLPSLALYAVLSGLSVLLIVGGFFASSDKLSGLLMNLATELLGAVIILILVERRLRPQDIVFLQSATTSLQLRLLLLISRQARQLTAYARVLRARIDAVAASPVYLDRGALEEDVRAAARRGILVLARPGEGKTRLLHYIASKEAEALLRDPRHAKVPIVIGLESVPRDDIAEHLFDEVRRYCSISAKTFRRLAEGRLLCLFDGLDEAADAHRVAADIAKFKQKYPAIEVVVTARGTLPMTVRQQLDLDVMEMPRLSPEEQERLVAAFRRAANG